jgi:SAM-dependent methyltransferase
MTQSGRRGYSLNEARLNRYDALSLLSVGRTFEFRRFLCRPNVMSFCNEIYQHGHHASVVNNHAKRKAEVEASSRFSNQGCAFLTLVAGPDRLRGLALRVEPAETVGIDASESVIETARSMASTQPVEHLTFEVGNIYEPRFPAESFDAVFAHQVLQHLSRPVDALRQFRSLLRSDGVVGARDVDWGSTTFYPENQGMRRFLTLYNQLARLNGGEPNAGRFLPFWFDQAGFVGARVTTSTGSYTDPVATREWGDSFADRTLQSNIAEKS